MNLLFVWTGVTAYMADCWRALAVLPGVRLKIVIQEKRHPGTQFDHQGVLRSLDVMLIYEDEPLDRDGLRKELTSFSPGLIFVVGWRAKLSRFIAMDSCFSHIPKVLIFDLPFAWTLKKLIAPVVLWFYIRRFQACFVPGARARRYARWLGFQERQIEQGLFAVGRGADTTERVLPENLQSARKGFLFVGRYAKEKRLDVLVKAYKRYRMLAEARNEVPWGLSCCGMGPDQHYIRDVEGITDYGFCQPEQVALLRLNHGALVLSSEFDPWPLVIAEACAVGLPVICTEACGSHIELIQGNGLVCKSNDAESLAQAMLAFHLLPEQQRIVMGLKGMELVKPYLSDTWTERVMAICKKLTGGDGGKQCANDGRDKAKRRCIKSSN